MLINEFLYETFLFTNYTYISIGFSKGEIPTIIVELNVKL